jgi:hypothetical protein
MVDKCLQQPGTIRDEQLVALWMSVLCDLGQAYTCNDLLQAEAVLSAFLSKYPMSKTIKHSSIRLHVGNALKKLLDYQGKLVHLGEELPTTTLLNI